MRVMIVLVLIIFFSCVNHEKKIIRSEVTHLLGSSINIPDVLFTNIKDSTFFTSKIRMVIYIDSSECTQCRLKDILFWDKVLEEISCINDFKLFLIFNPPLNELAFVENIFQECNFDYPVLYDYEGIFKSVNKLSQYSTFHTFLLDANNKIILAGSPVNNVKLWNLYKEEIEKYK